MSTHRLIDITHLGGRLTLTTEEFAHRWGLHPESLKRAMRNGSSPVRPIIPGAGRWVFLRRRSGTCRARHVDELTRWGPQSRSRPMMSAASRSCSGSQWAYTSRVTAVLV